MKGWPLMVMALMPLPLWAEVNRPDISYFTGPYERVGRDATGALLSDMVRLDPVDAQSVVMTVCSGDLAPVVLRYDNMFEVANFLSAVLDGEETACQYFNDSQNYPILNCFAAGNARFTLWPTPERERSCPAPERR